MKGKIFLLPFVVLLLSLVSCSESESGADSLVGCWSSKRFNPDMWKVFHLYPNETGSVEYCTPDTCFRKDEFTWRGTGNELFLTYKNSSTDKYYYCLDDGILDLFDSENEYEGSYNRKRDCHLI